MRGGAEAQVLVGFLVEPWVGVRHALGAGPSRRAGEAWGKGDTSSQGAGRAAAQVPVSSCGHERAQGAAAGSADLGSSVLMVLKPPG